MSITTFNLFTRLLINTGIILISQAALAAPVPVDTSALDRSQRSDTQFGIGFSSSVAQRPFIGVDDQVTSLPYIVLNYKDVYIEGINLGYKLWNQKDVSIDLLATPRFYEVKSSFADNGELDGIDKTRPTYLAGISTQYHGKLATLTLQLLGDLRESDGYEFIISASKAYKVADSFTLAPAIGFTYQDANLVDHFYGVQENEVRVDRPEYGGHASNNYHLTLTGFWKASKHIQLLAQLKYESLGSGTTNSPIIDEDSIVTGVIGAVYLF